MGSGDYSGKPEVFPVDPESTSRQESDSGALELFIVEGRSAALSIAALREPSFQAVMGLQGKPLNALKASEKKVAAHPFYSLLAQQVLGPHASGKLILLFDPDADGIHCSALLLGYILKYHRHTLERGRVFAARAPVLEVVVRRACADAQRTEPALDVFFSYADGTTNRLLQDIRMAGLEVVSRTYFRGLGGIPPKILKTQCVDPASRTLVPITTAEAETAAKIFLGI